MTDPATRDLMTDIRDGINDWLDATAPTEPPIEPPVEPPPSGSGRFSVVGRRIFDPNGRAFVPMGANVSAPLVSTEGDNVWWLAEQGKSMLGRSDDVLAWGWNTLRVNVATKTYNPIPGMTANFDGQKQGLLDLVDEYAAKEIVCILEPHQYINEDPLTDPAWQEIMDFWGWCVTQFRDEPYVWIGGPNEWLGGRDYDRFWEVTTTVHNFIRALNWNGLIIHALPDWSNNIQFFDDPGQVTNAKGFVDVVWDWHGYGGLYRPGEQWATRAMPYDEMKAIYENSLDILVTNHIPVMVGEFGHDWNPERRAADGWDYDSMVTSARLNLELLPAASIGMTVWHSNGSSGVATVFGLKNDDHLIFNEPAPDQRLAPLGQEYWSLLHP